VSFCIHSSRREHTQAPISARLAISFHMDKEIFSNIPLEKKIAEIYAANLSLIEDMMSYLKIISHNFLYHNLLK
jgi:hypothetical protein